MNCRHARNLFGAYWDDEITQAEREWLESHFSSCEPCRLAYEEFSRPLEALARMPRVDPEAGFADRVVARVRHVAPAPDRLPQATPVWVPVTAAAVLLLVTATLLVPWLGTRGGSRAPQGPSPIAAVRPSGTVEKVGGGVPREAVAVPSAPMASSRVPADSLFDHRADVEFILDPVTLRRGQATLSRQAPAAQGDRAVVSF